MDACNVLAEAISYYFGEPNCNEYLSSCKNFKFGCVTVLVVQLFNMISPLTTIVQKSTLQFRDQETGNRCFLYFHVLAWSRYFLNIFAAIKVAVVKFYSYNSWKIRLFFPPRIKINCVGVMILE